MLAFDKKVALSMAVHRPDITANAAGLISTLLVFGFISSIPFGNVNHLSLKLRDRFQAMESARKEMERIVPAQYKLYKYDNYKTAYVQMDKRVVPFSVSAIR